MVPRTPHAGKDTPKATPRSSKPKSKAAGGPTSPHTPPLLQQAGQPQPLERTPTSGRVSSNPFGALADLTAPLEVPPTAIASPGMARPLLMLSQGGHAGAQAAAAHASPTAFSGAAPSAADLAATADMPATVSGAPAGSAPAQALAAAAPAPGLAVQVPPPPPPPPAPAASSLAPSSRATPSASGAGIPAAVADAVAVAAAVPLPASPDEMRQQVEQIRAAVGRWGREFSAARRAAESILQKRTHKLETLADLHGRSMLGPARPGPARLGCRMRLCLSAERLSARALPLPRRPHAG